MNGKSNNMLLFTIITLASLILFLVALFSTGDKSLLYIKLSLGSLIIAFIYFSLVCETKVEKLEQEIKDLKKSK